MNELFFIFSLFRWLYCSQASQPNIVFILSDDLGWNDIGFHNASEIRSPNIDNLANTGLILNNYYIQHICSPTRSALLSGLYPIHTGLQSGVINPTLPYGLTLDSKILPKQFKDYTNYATHMIGKWHIGFFNWSYTPTYRGLAVFCIHSLYFVLCFVLNFSFYY